MYLGPRAAIRHVTTLGRTGKNLLEVVRYGGLVTGEKPAPYDVVERTPMYRLRRYGPPTQSADQPQPDTERPSTQHPSTDQPAEQPAPDQPADRPAVLLVPPLMLTAEVYDVSPNASAVRQLTAAGIDPWVIDFGSPEHEQGGTERTLADHVLAVSRAIDTVRARTGRDVHLAGYSQGGMFVYQAAAYRRGEGIASLITFGSPVHLRGALPLGIPEELGVRAAGLLVDTILDGRSVPGWATSLGFQLLDPVGSMRQQVEFLLQLHDREALLPRESQRRFLNGEGFVAWPGPALTDFLRQFVVHNRMLQGGFRIGDRLVTLADIPTPVLSFVGETDDIAPPNSVRPIGQAAPRAEIFEMSLRAGHFGLVVGRTAMARTWPAVAEWVRWREGEGEQPAGVVRAAEVASSSSRRHGHGNALAALGASMTAAADLSQAAVRGAVRSVQSTRDLAEEAIVQAPRLVRLGRTRPSTRLSLSLLLNERARRDPDDVLFVFEDRAYTNAEARTRIDNVVKGLVSIGVRGGEHVGVLMETRPSAFALIAALNRLGAVAVLLRPGGNTALEAELGAVTRIVADPENLAAAAAVRPGQVFLLGAPKEPRDAGTAVDLETVDVRGVALPAWYRPDPGKASDTAFVLFSGDNAAPQPTRITNGRWALSALGTASAAGMTDADTLYSVTPLHHPSGLLTSVGAAVASGARLALATRWDVPTFWQEVRRYGVTIVPYTWTQLHDLVEAPPHPLERAHSVRLFLGSGLPPGLWSRLLERFPPAQVLEFWVSTDSGAILANVRGAKVGALGRPLPGSPRVRIARYDVETGRMVEGRDGLLLEAAPGEMGLLLAERDPAFTDAEGLTGLFGQGDAWIPTRALVRRDADGDLWLMGTIDTVVRTARGPLLTRPVTNALETLPAVDLAVCYAVPDGDRELAVAAVTVAAGAELTADDLTRVLGDLPGRQRPDAVRVLAELPVSPWYRPLLAPLVEAGLPASTPTAPVFELTPDGLGYRPR